MKKPETIFKEKVLEDLRPLRGIWYYKSQEISRRGIPDLIMCVNGYFMALELKVDSALEALQIYNINQIRKANGYSAEVTPATWPQWLQTINQLLKEKK